MRWSVFPSSLRIRLWMWAGLPLFVIAALLVFAARWQALDTASTVQDGALAASVGVIAGAIQWSGDNAIRAEVPAAAIEMFASAQRDSVAYRIEERGKRLIAGAPDFVLPDDLSGTPLYFDTTIRGRPMRAAALIRTLYDNGHAREVVVAVAKTTRSHAALAASMWRTYVVSIVAMCFTANALLFVACAYELRALRGFRRREPNDPAPDMFVQDASAFPMEVRPLVHAFNAAVEQSAQHHASQRQFVSDAAHQLRTPLALLDTQIALARRQGMPGGLMAVFSAIEGSTRTMRDLTHRLLMLAQAEAAPASRFREPVDLMNVVTRVLESEADLAFARDIDLGADVACSAWVAGDEVLLSALLSNLVDNALKYVQRGGRVTVALSQAHARAYLSVIDNGPGIARASVERVFERFYRERHDVEGSGLGLPIVREIAARHGATVCLGVGEADTGLSVVVDFPALHTTQPQPYRVEGALQGGDAYRLRQRGGAP